MNPGGSVKDRAALGLVQWAEKTGQSRAAVRFPSWLLSRTQALAGADATYRLEGNVDRVLTPRPPSQAASSRAELSSRELQATPASASRTSAAPEDTNASSTCLM